MELGPPVVLIHAPLSNRRWDVEPDLIQGQTDDLPTEHATFHTRTLVVNEGEMHWRELGATISPANAELVSVHARVRPWAPDAVDPVTEHLKAPDRYTTLGVQTCTSVIEMTFCTPCPRPADTPVKPIPSQPVTPT